MKTSTIRVTPCIVVFLWPQMGLALATNWPIASITVKQQIYKPSGPGWSGFYDWLRDSSGKLLGIRYHPCEETAFVLEQASRLNYAERGAYGDMSLFFSNERSFDPKKSTDQDFLYDQLFVADDGSTAIAFAKELTQEELDSLRSARADWPDVVIVSGPSSR
ncbi:MAG TPA: hypothetical protein VI685_20900 [Candidatus Angelobacter sp.]